MKTRELRIDYNNNWPKKVLFPAENEFLNLIKSKGFEQILIPAKLLNCDNYQFQFNLGYLLEALDMLPLRPDFAFDHIWKALDSEFFLVQKERQESHRSRFDSFIDANLSNSRTASSFINYLSVIPYQTCEYAAKRIIYASAETDENSKRLFKSAKDSLGEDFIKDFLTKFYPTANANGKPTDSNQRNAGRLFKLIFNGQTVTLNNRLLAKVSLSGISIYKTSN